MKPVQSLLAISLVLATAGFMGCAKSNRALTSNPSGTTNETAVNPNENYRQEEAVRGETVDAKSVKVDKVSVDQAPTAVRDTFQKEFKNAPMPTDVSAISYRGTTILYNAETTKNGKIQEFFVLPDGKLASRETMNPNDLNKNMGTTNNPGGTEPNTSTTTSPNEGPMGSKSR